ncbi:hypothetical protein K435DRAFT_824981 [Dendrothele bispora CBS 962.96]|uniref:Bromo domain-containing protein n=1 Tax=Dendrothele bispora (strain CBS 962.96) TaxID=1314807 RepID=A0A4S8MZC9_DENBC|nr:hypothetical protein K435DRAFT_824981 [Dendrothele bispora CBS 962.96]
MSRATRRTQAEFELSSLDRLLLAQAVYELGGNAWPSVAKLLSKHPLLSHPRSFFTAQSCHAMYKQLRKEAELEITEADSDIHAPLNLKLAQIHYQARHTELRDLIAETEECFKKTAAEIEGIRNGHHPEPQDPIASDPQSTQNSESLREFDPSQNVDAGTASAGDKAGSDLSSPPSHEKVDQDKTVSTPPPEEPTVQESVPENENISISSTEAPEPVSDQVEEEKETVSEQERVSSPPSMPDAPSRQVIDIDRSFEPEPEDEEQQSPQLQSCVMSEPQNDQPNQPDADAEVSVTASQTPVAEPEVETEARTLTSSSPQIPQPSPENEMSNQEESQTEPMALDAPNLPSEPEAAEATPMDVDEPQIAVSEQPSESAPEDKTEPEALSQPSERTPEKTEQPEGDDDGATSGDEPPQKRSRTSTTRRGRTAMANRNSRNRRRRPSAPASERETEEPEDVKREPTEETTASPAPDANKRPDKRRISFADGHEMSKKRPRDDSEPVDEEESGPTPRVRRRNEGLTSKKFQNVIGLLHSQISQHRNGTIFHNPIRDSEAPDYHDIVKRPMDLKTIKTRIRDGVISNSLEFQRDIYLMFANAMMYNRPGSDVYMMAEDMMSDSEGYINTFRQTEGFVVGSSRR